MRFSPIAVAVAAAMLTLPALANEQHEQSQSGAAGGTSASGATSAKNEGKAAQSPELIKEAQGKLNVTADGKMGPATQKAVKEFQASKGLKASGQLDQQTIAALGVSGGESASAGASAAPKSESPAKQ